MPNLRAVRRILGIAGIFLAIPFLISVFLATGKHEGRTSTLTAAVAIVDSPPGLLSDIPNGANTALVKYVDALTTGLHTGANTEINNASDAGCECRVIGESFRAIYSKANLVGGSYSLKQSTVIHKNPREIELKVVIHMSDTTHIVRKTGSTQVWKGLDITSYFTLVNQGKAWTIHQTSVLP